ncbi:MAG: recombination regulator RecX [Spirochaetaceae bacterium]|jgi:regulatory protein|nr:recombination regulator RecX [Spirochaetaceae bacterium]
MATNTDNARAAALKLISRAEQCSALLTLKLRRRGYKKAEIEPLIDELREKGILDDNRFAGAWLAGRLAGRTDSPRKLFASLLAKGISEQTAKKSLKEILEPETESALLARYLQTARKNGKPVSRAALRSEGFSADALENAGL